MGTYCVMMMNLYATALSSTRYISSVPLSPYMSGNSPVQLYQRGCLGTLQHPSTIVIFGNSLVSLYIVDTCGLSSIPLSASTSEDCAVLCCTVQVHVNG